MATGTDGSQGIANVIATVPAQYRFRGLAAIGTIFFLLNLIFYVIIWIMLGSRFYFFLLTFKSSFTHPTESLFVPAAAVSFGTILINVVQYGMHHVGSWLSKATYVLFWLNATLAITLSISIYLLLFGNPFPLTPCALLMLPQMVDTVLLRGEYDTHLDLPSLPSTNRGPICRESGIKDEHPSRKLTIILAGFTVQGVGFLFAFSIYAAFIYRLMTQKLPRESLRPGMFVSVGPSGFTIAGTIAMAAQLPSALPENFMDAGDSRLTAQILQVMAYWMSLWIWG